MSRRVGAIIGFLPQNCESVSDVACARAQIAISAVKTGMVRTALATDISQSALCAAAKNISAHNLNERIFLKHSDGLRSVAARETQGVIIAGVGGPLAARILTYDAPKTRGFEFFILSPQSKPGALRRAVLETGLKIADELLVYEGGIFYPVIRAEAGFCAPYSETELCFGRALLARKDPVLKRFIETKLAASRDILKNAPAGARDKIEKNINVFMEAEKWFA